MIKMVVFMKEKLIKNKLLIAAIIVVAVVGGINIFPLLFSVPTINETESSLSKKVEEVEAPIELSITCVGDIMVHKPQIASQYNAETDTYDYTNNFTYVKDYITQADLSICNIETTFGGKQYSGYPCFCAPDELAAAVADTGFDIASTANNHMIDRGFSGLQRTLDVLESMGIETTGSRKTEGDIRFAMKEVKGINIAVIAYTYETTGLPSEDVYLNGIQTSSETSSLINSFNYQEIDSDLEKIKLVAEEAKEKGADIVIMFYHWGNEYQNTANNWQRYMAEQTANNMPVDIIFGSHPHVLQDTEMLVNDETGKKVPVFYSLGNFISNQRIETTQDKYTEMGVIANVNLDYMKSTKEILHIDMSAIPTWVDKYRVNGRDRYVIVPLDENIDANADLAASGHLNRAKTTMEEIDGLLKIN